MKRFSTLLFTLLLVLSAHAAVRDGHFFKTFSGQHIQAETAAQHFAEWFSLPVGTEWREVGRTTDQLGMTRIEYRQYLNGVEVAYSQILLHVKDGLVQSANGAVMEAERTPASVRQHGQVFKKGTPSNKLGADLYLIDTDNGYRYAYKTLSATGNWVYTDAETNEEITQVPLVRHFMGGDKKTIQSQSIFYGDVAITVNQNDADGQYTLYDSDRKIHTLCAANFPSVEKMQEDGILYDYFPALEGKGITNPVDVAIYIQNISPDLTNYMLDFGQVSSKNGEFYAYRVKSITIDKLKGVDPQGNTVDLIPSEKPLSHFRIQGLYNKTEGTAFDRLFSNYPATSFHVDSLAESYRLIPPEGVTVKLSGGTIIDPNKEMDMSNFYMHSSSFYFVPDESGVAVCENDNIKMTITYEKCASNFVDIHNGMERTYDYFKETFGRDSYDGKGSPIYNLTFIPGGNLPSSLIGYSNEGYDFETDDFLALHAAKSANSDNDVMEQQNYLFTCEPVNAFANNGTSPYVMMYGTGGYMYSFSTYSRPVVELSVMCHEFTHLITASVNAFKSGKESGALNESFSDVMSISMMKSSKYGYGPDTPWIMGGNNLMDRVSNMRDLANPENSMGGQLPAPDTYKGKYWFGEDDESDITDASHTNNSVQNKFYQLLCDGGTDTNDNGYTYIVNGIGVDKAQHIAFRTLVQYATSASDFADIRKCFIQAAKDLHGENSDEVRSVAQAWDAVGVYDGDGPTSIVSLENDQRTTDGAVYDLQGRRVDTPSHGIYIRNGRKIVVR